LTVYADTSFLFSRYLTDGHSPEVDRRMGLHPGVLVTSFHRAELANAMFQWAFRGTVSAQQAEAAFADFEADCVTGVWQRAILPDTAYDTSVRLARRHVASIGVRTLDTLHVAAALELKATRFWTFDERQAKLAEAEGLTTT
jgi:predicted nucleic acid-binding protein